MILKKTGDGELDLEPAAVIRGKSAEEVEDAIAEGASKGEGTYIALSVSGKVEKDVVYEATITDPEVV